MSAAAAPARIQKSKRQPAQRITDEERKATIPSPKGNWTAVDNGYFDILPSKISGLPYVAIGQVIRRSYGGAGRPEWVPLKATELAELAVATVEGAEKALQEAVDKGFLDVRKDGRKYLYRVALSAFAVPEDKEPRKLERKPAQMELEPRPAFLPQIYIEPGEISDPFALSEDLNARYRNNARFPLNILTERDEDGTLEIGLSVEEKSSEDQANHTPTRVRQSKLHPAETKGKHENRRDIAVMRDFLVRWAGKKIGSPPDDTQVSGILAAMNGHGRDRLARALDHWEAGKPATWEAVENIARSLEEKKPARGKVPDSFARFLEAGTKAGLPASEVDWNKARKIWMCLTMDEQFSAVQGIEDRIACGEFAEARFRPRPDRFLADKAWQRNLRPGKAARTAKDEAASGSLLDATRKHLARTRGSR